MTTPLSEAIQFARNYASAPDMDNPPTPEQMALILAQIDALEPIRLREESLAATQAQIDRARSEHGHGELEIDDGALTSRSNEPRGTWVAAWVWLGDEVAACPNCSNTDNDGSDVCPDCGQTMIEGGL